MDIAVVVVVIILVGFFALPIQTTRITSFLVDNANCKCLPYHTPCSMEVIDVMGRSALSAKTRICWQGTLLCCHKSTLPGSKTGKEMGFFRGFVLRKPQLQVRSPLGSRTLNNTNSEERKYNFRLRTTNRTIVGTQDFRHLTTKPQILKSELRETGTTRKVSPPPSTFMVHTVRGNPNDKNTVSLSNSKSNIDIKPRRMEEYSTACVSKVTCTVGQAGSTLHSMFYTNNVEKSTILRSVNTQVRLPSFSVVTYEKLNKEHISLFKSYSTTTHVNLMSKNQGHIKTNLSENENFIIKLSLPSTLNLLMATVTSKYVTSEHYQIPTPILSAFTFTAPSPILVLKPDVYGSVVVLTPAVEYYGTKTFNATESLLHMQTLIPSSQANLVFLSTTSVLRLENVERDNMLKSPSVVNFSHYAYKLKPLSVFTSIYFTANPVTISKTQSVQSGVQYIKSKTLGHSQYPASTEFYKKSHVLDKIAQKKSIARIEELLPSKSWYTPILLTYDPTLLKPIHITLVLPPHRHNTPMKKEGDSKEGLTGPVTHTSVSNSVISTKIDYFSKVTHIDNVVVDTMNNFSKLINMANMSVSAAMNIKISRDEMVTLPDAKEKFLSVNDTELLSIKLATTASRNVTHTDDTRGKSLNIDQTLSPVKEFRAFLRSLKDKKINKTKTDVGESSGLWGWWFD